MLPVKVTETQGGSTETGKNNKIHLNWNNTWQLQHVVYKDYYFLHEN